MSIRVFAAGVVALCAVTGVGISQGTSARTALSPQVLGAADQSATTHFNAYLPLTHQAALEQLLSAQTDVASPSYHHWLTPADFKTKFGPSAADLAKVKATMQAAGLTVVAEHTQSLEIEGPVWAVEKLFATRLQQVQMKSGKVKFAAAQNHLVIPDALSATGVVVPEFTPRVAHVHSRRIGTALTAASPSTRLTSNDSFFYPNDLNEAYKLPSFTTIVTPLSTGKPVQLAGVGSHIGIVISSVISPADLAKTFNSKLNLSGGASLVQAYSANTTLPVPTVTIRTVGAGSGPFNPNDDAAGEASLDTQMSLGTAPGAQETLYNVEDLSDSALMAGYTAIDEDNAVDVVSSSFGGCELEYLPAYNNGVDFTGILKAYHALFQQGNAQGITFVASSGDNGALACLSVAFNDNPSNGTSFVPGVEWPAADPSVTGVGGTNLTTTATPGIDDAKYSIENANYDPRVPAEFELSPTDIVTVNNNTWGSGGGVSKIFDKPLYQYLVDTGNDKHRTVPDVSLMMGGCPGDADLSVQDCTTLPRSAAIIWIGGEADLLIGTSSSSPELAGVLALAIEENGGRLGNVNPLIYGLSALQTLLGGTDAPAPLKFFHRSIVGDNNFYKVHKGDAYSKVLGNSTLDVKKFLLQQLAKPAGAPNTASNP
ncbi:S53 family peptidase [Granulicella arctica]|uniref:S53 family peptidase n=1 Tax=Granulicella arctica TaxID=940613 RepID=UPI0021E09AEB|nr:S53 family peptidase [Granulicella arctica]